LFLANRIPSGTDDDVDWADMMLALVTIRLLKDKSRFVEDGFIVESAF
jgi:hypothetical protein